MTRHRRTGIQLNFMPIYEYRCRECGAKFEKLRRISEAEKPAECPKCGKAESDLQLSCFATSGCNAPAGSGFS